MNRYMASALLVVVNLAVIMWFLARNPGSAAALFLATLLAVGVSAIVQRLRFGRDMTRRARFDPLVVSVFLASFDLVFLGLSIGRVA